MSLKTITRELQERPPKFRTYEGGRVSKRDTLHNEIARTILVQFKNRALESAIKAFADKRGLKVFYGRQGKPDFLAIGSAVKVIDPLLLREQDWGAFVEINENGDRPCIIVSKPRTYEAPKERGNVHEFDIEDPDTPDKVLAGLEKIFAPITYRAAKRKV